MRYKKLFKTSQPLGQTATILVFRFACFNLLPTPNLYLENIFKIVTNLLLYNIEKVVLIF